MNSRRKTLMPLLVMPLVLVGCSTFGSPDESSVPASSEVATSSPVSADSTGVAKAQEVEKLGVEIVEVYPFDASTFTQGLEYEPEGTLLVSGGFYGESTLYRSTLDGEKLTQQFLPGEHFGEGLTRHGNSIWQLTWREGLAYQRNVDDLAAVNITEYSGEGWGLCSFQDEFIFSDGSSRLKRLDSASFQEVGSFEVTLEGEPVSALNELECVAGPRGPEIYANIFMTTDIVRIEPATGQVTGVIDASSLPNNADPDHNSVLNGIAWIPEKDQFLLGGKRWPDLYQVRIVPAGELQR